MALQPSTPRRFARQCDLCRYVGRSRRKALDFPRRKGEIWVVLHRGAEEWTHVYRLDARDGRTVHLERFAKGDARAALFAWAEVFFQIETTEAIDRAA